MVIAIIGILSSVVLASLNSARDKAKIAAFKSEMSAQLPQTIIECDDGAPTVPTDSTNTDWAGAFTATSCGATGSATFSITATPVDTGLTCTGTMAETGVTYVGADC